MSAHDLDNLSRNVYGLFGIPVDTIAQERAVKLISGAAARRRPYLISTCNLNFLIQSLSDFNFRESLLLSDLCTADGAPLVWLARLMGIPIPERVAGSDLFEILKYSGADSKPLRVFFFGGPEGVAEAACATLNARSSNLVCVGSYFPGFGDLDQMSSDDIIFHINASCADLLSVSLGAQKGQAWLIRNHERIATPVRVHLGATINFEIGKIKRAPKIIRNSGMEWLWRIKEEPRLWRRYWRDALRLGAVLATQALPLLLLKKVERQERPGENFEIRSRVDDAATTVYLSGPATHRHVSEAVPVLRLAVSAGKRILIDCASMTTVDERFIGLLLLVYKEVAGRGGLQLINVPKRIHRRLKLCAFEYLTSSLNV